MGRSTKEAWLSGPGDLQEANVKDVPVKGQTVRVRGLPAAYSNEAQSAAVEQTQRGVDTVSRVNKNRMEVLQFAHGVIDPEFTVEEAEEVSKKYGPAFRKIIDEIDRLSGLDKEAIAAAEERFPAGGSSAQRATVDVPNGSGDGESAVSARVGVGTGDTSRGDV